MTDQAFRTVRIVAPDGALVRALSEHRSDRTGWLIAALDDGTPEPDALVILDLDSMEEQSRWTGTLRAGGFSGPIVVLGGDDQACGPDDEPLPRPVRLVTLLARLDAHATEPVEAAVHALGPYDFLVVERALRHRQDDTLIRLTDLERRLLLSLITADGATLPREALLERVWGYSQGTLTHTVETHIWRLRQKIETDDPTTGFLVTEPGGYRLARV